ncbi:unnamed protein product [Trichobilharzia regenti]|nr:unnamed protein product [Trichobilharzia regenti]
MKSWSGQWHMPTARYIRYNITVSSFASSIGVFMRHNTMPTIVHYDIFDRITGHNLLANSGRQQLGSRTKRSAPSNRITKSLLQVGSNVSFTYTFPLSLLIIRNHNYSFTEKSNHARMYELLIIVQSLEMKIVLCLP